MRKTSLRTVLIVLLVMCSIFSYVYINTVQVSDVKAENTNNLQPKVEKVDQEMSKQQRIMPDVEIMKFLLEKGKQILPAS